MRIDRADLSSPQRRKISRMVKRMISRETSGIESLVSELRHSIAEMRGVDGTHKKTQHYNVSSGEDGKGIPHECRIPRPEDDDPFW